MSKLNFTRAQTPEQIFLALSQFQDDLERRIAFGTGTVSFSGLSNQASVQVTHELPGTPRLVLITGTTRDIAIPLAWEAVSVGATQFTANGMTIDGSTPAGGKGSSFYWLAIV